MELLHQDISECRRDPCNLFEKRSMMLSRNILVDIACKRQSNLLTNKLGSCLWYKASIWNYFYRSQLDKYYSIYYHTVATQLHRYCSLFYLYRLGIWCHRLYTIGYLISRNRSLGTNRICLQ